MRDVTCASTSRTASPSANASRVLGSFPASHPRGSWPADEFAAARRAEGLNVAVVMDLATDNFLVKAVA
jgi:hypothetical protein